MTSVYAYTPEIWPPLVGAIFLALVGLYAWRRRDVPAALPLVAGSLFAILWLLGIALEAAAVAPATKIAWYKFQTLWRLPAITADTCFVLEYVYPGRWLTRRNLTLLALVPLLAMLLVVTNNEWIIWRSVDVGSQGTVVAYLTPAGTVAFVYALALLLVNAAALIWLFVRSPQHRWPVALMLCTQLAARGVYALKYAYLPLPTQFDPDIVTLLLVWGTYAIVLFGFRIFDPLPAARATAIRQMREGMVVFDAGWRIASLNPAAASMLSTSASRAHGKTLAELLPAFSDLSARLAATLAGVDQTEISLGTGSSAPLYALDHSPLKDFRGATIGHLLLLHDVTEQRRAQAQLLEQRTAMAALHEREQMARELHDGLSQVLGYIKMQAQAARSLLAQERKAEADSYLMQLASVAQDLHADVREYIFQGSAASPLELGLNASLQQYLERFSQNHSIRTELRMSPEMSDERVEPTVAVQLLRIIQEALTNAVKHAHASLVRVNLTARDGAAEVTIADDGQGFDPGQARSDGFGLRFMQERAEGIGGSVQVRSAPGQGTQVVVEVPLRKEPVLNRGKDGADESSPGG